MALSSVISVYIYMHTNGCVRRAIEYNGPRNWVNTFFWQFYADELLGEASTG